MEIVLFPIPMPDIFNRVFSEKLRIPPLGDWIQIPPSSPPRNNSSRPVAMTFRHDAEVEAIATGPDGTMYLIPLDWTVERDGEYSGTFTPPGDGEYAIRVTAKRGEEQVLGSDEVFLHAGPSLEEFFDAGLRRGALERLAAETGGAYYEPETVATLPEDIRYTGAGVTLTEERDLWDMPALFFLLIGLVAGEWTLRRRRGLV